MAPIISSVPDLPGGGGGHARGRLVPVALAGLPLLLLLIAAPKRCDAAAVHSAYTSSLWWRMQALLRDFRSLFSCDAEAIRAAMCGGQSTFAEWTMGAHNV